MPIVRRYRIALTIPAMFPDFVDLPPGRRATRVAAQVILLVAGTLVVLLAPGGVARACGYEDPATLAIGALNFAYPDALYVGTAVWQAQVEGRLPRNEPAAPPTSGDAIRRQAATWEATRLNERLRAVFDGWPEGTALPAMAFVDTGLWTRFERQSGKLVTLSHQTGPAGEAVVLVTMPVALRAVLDGRISFAAALKSGIMRAYGSEAAQERLRDAWQPPVTDSPPSQ